MKRVNHINEKNVNRFGSEMIIVNQYKIENKKYKHLGYFDTYEKAYDVYRIEKQRVIDELIDDYFNKIPYVQYEKLRKAISRYEL